jgi:hypothetical protein
MKDDSLSLPSLTLTPPPSLSPSLSPSPLMDFVGRFCPVL